MGRDPFDQYADAIALITTAHKKQKPVVELLREFPEISTCHSLSGDYDLMVRIRVIHLEDMLPVIEAIEDIPGVESVKSIIILATNFDHLHDESHLSNLRHVAAFAKGEVG